MSANPRDFVLSLAATLLAGAVAVPMPAILSRRSAPRIQAIVRAADLAAIIAPSATFGADWLPGEEWPAHLRRIPLENLKEQTPEEELMEIGDLSSPALLQFTSGSTSAPSGVLLSHANIAANCAAIASAYDLTVESVGLSWLPLHHDMGLVGHVLMPMWLGGRSVLMDPLRFLQKPLRWLEAIGDERATITSAPNFAYELCSRAAATGQPLGFDLTSLDTAVCGGEPVMPDTIDAFAGLFAARGFRRSAFAPSYGLAEATLLVSTGKSAAGPSSMEMPPREGAKADRPSVTNVGAPVPGASVRVVNPADGEILPDMEVGEIEVAGDGVGTVLGAPPSDWVRTGDLGFLSAGQLFVAGRSKELLILRGQNVFPADIEAAALKAAAIIVPGGVAAVGVVRGGTQAMILIAEARTFDQGGGLGRKIGEAVALATGHVPEDIVLVAPGALPRTTSGKLRRGEIARLYEAGELATGSQDDVHPVKETLEHA